MCIYLRLVDHQYHLTEYHLQLKSNKTLHLVSLKHQLHFLLCKMSKSMDWQE